MSRISLVFSVILMVVFVGMAFDALSYQAGQDALKLNPRCSSRGTVPEFDAVSQTVKLFDHYDCKVKR